MKCIPTTALLLAAVFTTGNLRAADDPGVDDATTGLRLSLETDYNISGANKIKQLSNRMGSLASRDASIKITGRIPLAATDQIGVGASLEQTDLDHCFPGAGRDTGSPFPERLRSTSIDLSWQHRFDERWSSILAMSPGLNWAGSRCERSAFGVRGIAGAVVQQNANLKLLAGIVFDSQSTDYKVLPAVGLEWKSSDQWTVALGFPHTAVTFNVSPDFALALEFEANTRTYDVADDPWRGFTGNTDHLLDDSKFEYSDARVGLKATYRFSPRCALNAAVGSVVYREGEYHKDGLKVPKFKSDGLAAYGSLGLTVSF